MATNRLHLGKETGSLVNHIMSANSTAPEVGKGCTVLGWTDRHAYEVLSVENDGTRITIQQYRAVRVDPYGQSEDQTYRYEELIGRPITVVLRKGVWMIERKEVVFTKELNELAMSRMDWCTDELRAELWHEDVVLRLIPGKTRLKTSYTKTSILWGVKQEYYDYSF